MQARGMGSFHVGRISLRTLQRGIVAAIITLSLGGCLSSNVSVYNPIDNADRTITVPADDTLLSGAIKRRLQAIGWKLTLDSDPTQAAGTPTPTRYRLVLRQSQVDSCYPKGGPEINYSLILMDNKTRDAVVTADGRDCTDAAVDKFIAALRRAGRH
jgi:hypothetical protein